MPIVQKPNYRTNLSSPSKGRIHCGCGAENVEGCERCRRCKDCTCMCKACRVCGKKECPPKHFCRNCMGCRGKCGCKAAPQTLRRDEKIVLGLTPETQKILNKEGKKFKPAILVNKLKRAFGLEIECVPAPRDFPYGLNDVPYLSYGWVRDGSLNFGGSELVVQPLWGDRFEEGITKLAEHLALYRAGVDDSCGYHVHVGATDFDVFSLRRLLIGYCKVEKDIFGELIPLERTEKKYCKPYRMSEDWFRKLKGITRGAELKKFILNWLYGDRLRRVVVGDNRVEVDLTGIRGIRNHKYEDCRYHGLNLHSWMQRSTVEWRQHPGTIKVDALLGWAKFCGWFTEVMWKLKDEEVEEIRGLEDAIHGEWKHQFEVVRFPSEVVNWVEKRREEMRNGVVSW